MAGDPGFLAALDDLKALHISKGHDYADSTDPLKNYVQSAKDSGVEPWRAAFLRLSEKYHRVVNLLNKVEEPNHESLDDTFMDLAAMSLIVRSLRAREAFIDNEQPDAVICPRDGSTCWGCSGCSPQGDGDTGESAVGAEPV